MLALVTTVVGTSLFSLSFDEEVLLLHSGPNDCVSRRMQGHIWVLDQEMSVDGIELYVVKTSSLEWKVFLPIVFTVLVLAWPISKEHPRKPIPWLYISHHFHFRPRFSLCKDVM